MVGAHDPAAAGTAITKNQNRFKKGAGGHDPAAPVTITESQVKVGWAAMTLPPSEYTQQLILNIWWGVWAINPIAPPPHLYTTDASGKEGHGSQKQWTYHPMVKQIMC